MFKKLHRQMTIFASLITSGILILMAVSCLVISERGLTHNTYERFLNNGNSCVAYLENQTVLSHKWILEAKQEYKVEFRIRNNGKKLYFDRTVEMKQPHAYNRAFFIGSIRMWLFCIYNTVKIRLFIRFSVG